MILWVYSVIPQLVKIFQWAYSVIPTTDFVSFQPHDVSSGW